MNKKIRAALAAAFSLAAAPAPAQTPVGPLPTTASGTAPYTEERGAPVVPGAPRMTSREEALVPSASLGTLGSLGKQADVELETCIIRPVMTDAQLKLCGANPAALQTPAKRK